MLTNNPIDYQTPSPKKPQFRAFVPLLCSLYAMLSMGAQYWIIWMPQWMWRGRDLRLSIAIWNNILLLLGISGVLGGLIGLIFSVIAIRRDNTNLTRVAFFISISYWSTIGVRAIFITN